MLKKLLRCNRLEFVILQVCGCHGFFRELSEAKTAKQFKEILFSNYNNENLKFLHENEREKNPQRLTRGKVIENRYCLYPAGITSC